MDHIPSTQWIMEAPYDISAREGVSHTARDTQSATSDSSAPTKRPQMQNITFRRGLRPKRTSRAHLSALVTCLVLFFVVPAVQSEAQKAYYKVCTYI